MIVMACPLAIRLETVEPRAVRHGLPHDPHFPAEWGLRSRVHQAGEDAWAFVELDQADHVWCFEAGCGRAAGGDCDQPSGTGGRPPFWFGLAIQVHRPREELAAPGLRIVLQQKAAV